MVRRAVEQISAQSPLHEYRAGYIAPLLRETGADMVSSHPDPTSNAARYGCDESWF